MYVLIDTDKMELLAKHPNWMTLHQLGIIICPESTLVTPVDNLNDLDDIQAQLLYINLTDNLNGAPYEREIVNHILSDCFAQLPETALDHAEACAQAEFCVEYDIQGLCSFQPGQMVPSMEEGLWESLRCERNAERENAIISGSWVVPCTAALQPAWSPGRGARS